MVIPEPIVCTEVPERFAEAGALDATTLTEHDGVTTLQTLMSYPSRPHREGYVRWGTEAGIQQTFDRLDDADPQARLLAFTGRSPLRGEHPLGGPGGWSHIASRARARRGGASAPALAPPH